jgi:hypothetical protein
MHAVATDMEEEDELSGSVGSLSVLISQGHPNGGKAHKERLRGSRGTCYVEVYIDA